MRGPGPEVYQLRENLKLKSKRPPCLSLLKRQNNQKKSRRNLISLKSKRSLKFLKLIPKNKRHPKMIRSLSCLRLILKNQIQNWKLKNQIYPKLTLKKKKKSLRHLSLKVKNQLRTHCLQNPESGLNQQHLFSRLGKIARQNWRIRYYQKCNLPARQKKVANSQKMNILKKWKILWNKPCSN